MKSSKSIELTECLVDNQHRINKSHLETPQRSFMDKFHDKLFMKVIYGVPIFNQKK